MYRLIYDCTCPPKKTQIFRFESEKKHGDPEIVVTLDLTLTEARSIFHLHSKIEKGLVFHRLAIVSITESLY